MESFIRHWRRAAIFMLCGGLLGWLLWMFLPQEYTAVSHLSVGIDYNRTGKLDDTEQDRLLGITEDIIHSDTVMQVVFQQSAFSDYDSFFKKTLTTRTNDSWSLAITGKDPEAAGRLSLLWLSTAHEALQTAKEHAIREEALQNELEGMTMCIQDSQHSALPSGCPDDPELTMERINLYADLIRQEAAGSHGLSTAIRIGQMNPDQLEIRSSSRSAAADTFLGALTGLLLAFAWPWFSKNGN